MKTEQSYRNKSKGNTCVPAETLWDYLEGKLTAKQQHRVEAHLLDCPMCADALEGFQKSGNRDMVTRLNAEIAKQVTYRSNWYLTAAAASVVLVAAFGLLWWGLDNRTTGIENVAQETPVIKKQEAISAAPEELRGPGSPTPELNRPSTSDGNIPYNQNGTDQASAPPPSSAPVVTGTLSLQDRNYVTNAATATDPIVTVPTEQESVQYAKEDDASDEQNLTGKGVATGASSGPSPQPTAPAGPPAPKPVQSYRDGSNSKTAKNKQAPAAAESHSSKASLAEGMQYYNTGNYTEAIKVFKEVLNDNASNQEARYYLGMSYKGNGDKSKAIDELGKVESTCLYYDDALWNRSLLLIEAGRKEEAKPLLQKLVDGAGKYSQKAMNKLNEL